MKTDALIVEDHPVVVEGLMNILQNHPALKNIYTAFDGVSCIRVMQNLSPPLVLLDINLPDANGVDLCNTIKEGWPGTMVIAISSCTERSIIKKMISAGASGYLLKNAPGDEIADAISKVLSGYRYFDKEVEAILASSASKQTLPLLTRREQEVLVMIAEGLTNGEIAEKSFVSTLTIDTHRKNLLVKLGAKNSAALVRIAIEQGLIPGF
jgi:DNA-binding NarL/FixJ family response regulator